MKKLLCLRITLADGWLQIKVRLARYYFLYFIFFLVYFIIYLFSSPGVCNLFFFTLELYFGKIA